MRTPRTERQRVVNALELWGCGYIDADTVSAVCPLCREPLAVTFRETLVELRCCGVGCDEADIARALFGLSEAA